MPQVCAEKTGYQHISIHFSMVCMGMSLVFVFNLSLDVPFFLVLLYTQNLALATRFFLSSLLFCLFVSSTLSF